MKNHFVVGVVVWEGWVIWIRLESVVGEGGLKCDVDGE